MTHRARSHVLSVTHANIWVRRSPEMGQMTSYCRECGQEQLFDQPHEGQGCCPDAPDGDCLEWACTGCGAALFIGIPDVPAGLAGLRDRPGRVA